MRKMVFCQVVNQGDWCAEYYATGDGDVGRRARQLRKAGYQVTTHPMGSQITKFGRVQLTRLHILPGTHEGTFGLPSENWVLEKDFE